MVLTIFGFYDLRHWRNHLSPGFLLRQPTKVMVGGFLLTLLVLSVLVSPEEISLSRKALTALLIAGIAFASRIGLCRLLRYCRSQRIAIVVVKDRSAKAPVRNLIKTYCSDYLVSAVLALEDLSGRDTVRPGINSISGGESLEILHSMNGNGASTRLQKLLQLRHSGLTLTPLAEVLEQATGRLAHLEKSDLAPLSGDLGKSHYEIAKRIADVLLSSLGLVIFLPLGLLLAALIKLDSPGPIFYRQRRVGRQGKTFEVIKLRSMGTNAEQGTGAVWAKQTDPRATRVGKWLRQLHLDEIPQLLNILKGEMSLVGPRPERPEMIPILSQALPAYPLRLRVLPGLTGWAQINRPADSNWEDVASKLDYDLYYLKYRNFMLDIRIILRTLDIVLFGVRVENIPYPGSAYGLATATASREAPKRELSGAVIPAETGALRPQELPHFLAAGERNLSASAGMAAGK